MKKPACASPGRGVKCLFLLSLFIIASFARAGAPKWVTEASAEIAGHLKAKEGRIVLLDYEKIDFIKGGRTHILSRKVQRITLQGIDDPGLICGYNADTDRIIRLKAWIISPDGKKTQSFGRGDFVDQVAILDDNYWNAHRALRFAGMKSIRAGATLAWEVEMEKQPMLADSSWYFPESAPVVKSVYEVSPAVGGKLVFLAMNSDVPAPREGASPGSLKWEMQNIPAVPPRELMHHVFLTKPLRVMVRCLNVAEPANNIETWTQFAGRAADIVEPRIVASAAITEQAATLVKDKSKRWERIAGITEFVQRQIKYLSVTLDKDSLAGYRPHLPEETLKKYLGDCKDKAALTAAMLRAIGDNAYIILVSSGNPSAVVKEWPGPSFNHAIVAIPADDDVPASWPQIDNGVQGKFVLFDPTNPFTPLGILPPEDQGGLGLVVSKQTPGLASMPVETPESNSLERKIEGQLTPTGDLRIKINETRAGSSGALAHYKRFQMGKEKYTRSLEAQLHENNIAAVKDLKWTDDWQPAEVRSHFELQFTAERRARMMGPDMMLISPRLLTNHASFGAWTKEHADGQLWLPAQGIREEITLRLPEGFTADGLPSAWQQELPFASASLTYRIEGEAVVYQCTLRQKAGLYGRKDYDLLRAFYQKLDEAERRSVVIRKTVVAAAVAP